MATSNAPAGWLEDYFAPGKEHADIGIVFVHGFTGSPASMRPWAAYFEERGYTVSVPRLPGHATEWQDLVGVLNYVKSEPSLSAANIALVVHCMGAA